MNRELYLFYLFNKQHYLVAEAVERWMLMRPEVKAAIEEKFKEEMADFTEPTDTTPPPTKR
jgi:hypothetical protein